MPLPDSPFHTVPTLSGTYPMPLITVPSSRSERLRASVSLKKKDCKSINIIGVIINVGANLHNAIDDGSPTFSSKFSKSFLVHVRCFKSRFDFYVRTCIWHCSYIQKYLTLRIVIFHKKNSLAWRAVPNISYVFHRYEGYAK